MLSKSSSCVIVVIVNLFGASLSGSSLDISLENRLQLIMTLNATPKPRRTCTRFLLKCLFNMRRQNDDTDDDGRTSQNMYLTEYVHFTSIQFCTLTRRSTLPAHNPRLFVDFTSSSLKPHLAHVVVFFGAPGICEGVVKIR